jgi:hypothetical protein
VRTGCPGEGEGPAPELSGSTEGREFHQLSDYKLLEKPANTADAPQLMCTHEHGQTMCIL